MNCKLTNVYTTKLTCIVLSFSRHTSNLTVSFYLIPVNDNPPVTTPQYNNVYFTEGSNINGISVFPTLNIIDADEECSNSTLQFVEVILYAVDRGDESISVRYQLYIIIIINVLMFI